MNAIHINGWSSFAEWRDAGYPGAKSFPPERPALSDERRGICEWEKTNCPRISQPGSRFCRPHLDVIHAMGIEDIRLLNARSA